MQGSITLYSQATVDLLPLLSEIRGDLTIYEHPQSLARFGCLRKVTGSVTFKYTSMLSRLDGLERLESIDGQLLIERNDVLSSVAGLRGLRNVGSISVLGNTGLQLAGSRTCERRALRLGNPALATSPGSRT